MLWESGIDDTSWNSGKAMGHSRPEAVFALRTTENSGCNLGWKCPGSFLMPRKSPSLRARLSSGLEVKAVRLRKLPLAIPSIWAAVLPAMQNPLWAAALFCSMSFRIIISRKPISAISNPELINVYRVVQSCVQPLIQQLEQFSAQYLPLDSDARKAYYYEKRARFNAGPFCAPNSPPDLERAALFLFLNRTCFNGLYRVSRSGQFNVPIGAIARRKSSMRRSCAPLPAALKNVVLFCGGYAQSADFVDAKTFVYLDPPYRPLSPTSSFTAYTQDAFDDDDQRSLAEFFKAMAARGASLLLSNSDPKNTNPDDNFFDELYAPFHIHRLRVGRAISAQGRRAQKSQRAAHFELSAIGARQ